MRKADIAHLKYRIDENLMLMLIIFVFQETWMQSQRLEEEEVVIPSCSPTHST